MGTYKTNKLVVQEIYELGISPPPVGAVFPDAVGCGIRRKHFEQPVKAVRVNDDVVCYSRNDFEWRLGEICQDDLRYKPWKPESLEHCRWAANDIPADLRSKVLWKACRNADSTKVYLLKVSLPPDALIYPGDCEGHGLYFETDMRKALKSCNLDPLSRLIWDISDMMWYKTPIEFVTHTPKYLEELTDDMVEAVHTAPECVADQDARSESAPVVARKGSWLGH